jgi:glycosyltransferase involved in cell wall biosynthesis
MKISSFNFNSDIGGGAMGSALQSGAIADGLRRRGHDVRLHFPAVRRGGHRKAGGGTERTGALRRYGHIPKLFARNAPWTRRCLETIDLEGPDLVLGLNSLCNVALPLACRIRSVPLVLLCEEPAEYEYSFFYSRYYTYPALSRWLEKAALDSAAQVLCISEVLKGYLVRSGLDATRLHVVPNGVDHRLFRPMPQDEGLRDSLGLTGRLTIGFVGSFNFFPDVRAFIAEARYLVDAHPDVRFLFVGQATNAGGLEQAAASAGLGGSFVFAGPSAHERIPAYLSIVDVAISPYRSDYLFYGSSMKVLEYMAAGKPVVAPAMGQLKELVLDGHNGLLYEAGDLASFGSKVAELVRDPALRARLGEQARRTVERGWTWDVQAQRIERVLLKALDRHGAPRKAAAGRTGRADG